ncbi:C39 family peptidase [Oscillibacter sp.]|uniref:C39 family peptidase n=1 Tax=Oscillibacter sp. TaxID=1945593 RepID=UPI0028A5B1EE|nr:C39 family peptidase [Oscillibacter sp.]
MKRNSHLKKVLAISVLAVVCIGTAELAVCRVADPALYERIMDPVRRTVSSGWTLASDGARTVYDAVSDGASWAWDKTSSAVTGVLRKDGEDLESQAVLEPDEKPAPLADPAATTLEQRETGEILTGGNREIVYYNQTDDAWSDQPYGRDTLGAYGCGPTCLSMAVSSLTDQAVDPEEMARWAAENGHWARRSGSYLSIVNGAAAAYGLEAESLPNCDAERLRLELAAGKMAVALMTKGHFTNGGHFILLRGATLNGGILVADPSSRERSLAVWDPQLILDELSKSRSSGAPLWILSPANS